MMSAIITFGLRFFASMLTPGPGVDHLVGARCRYCMQFVMQQVRVTSQWADMPFCSNPECNRADYNVDYEGIIIFFNYHSIRLWVKSSGEIFLHPRDIAKYLFLQEGAVIYRILTRHNVQIPVFVMVAGLQEPTRLVSLTSLSGALLNHNPRANRRAQFVLRRLSLIPRLEAWATTQGHADTMNRIKALM